MSDHPKLAAASHEIIDVIRHRWSPRAFDPGRTVSQADFFRLFEAARWAPSSGNEQPWRFVVAGRANSPEAFEALLGSLEERNRVWARSAPLLILVAVRHILEQRDVVNTHAWYDTGQAVGFLTLQATAMGLALRQMQGFDRDLARTAANVPEPFNPAVVMALGYAGDPDSLEIEKHRDQERQRRVRRPIEGTVFDATWGKAFA